MTRHPPVRAASVALLGVVLTLASACGGSTSETEPPAPATATGQATPPGSSPSPTAAFTVPAAAPSGRLEAEVQQSSRDALRGEFQVWLDNGTGAEVVPTALTYVDPRLTGTRTGERMRAAPPGSHRGFPADLGAPACAAVPAADVPAAGTAAPYVVVATADGEERLEVADPARVIERYVAQRCLELAVADAATIAFGDGLRVTSADGGTGARADLDLVVTPTESATPLRVVAVQGTTLLSGVGGTWPVDVEIGGTGATAEPVRRVLEAHPTRCDPHAVAESGRATIFRVEVVLGTGADARSGLVDVRLGTEAGRQAYDFVAGACWGG